jgi:hypothetical protein
MTYAARYRLRKGSKMIPADSSNSHPNEYAEHWQRFRLLKRFILAIWIGWVPVLIASILIARNYRFVPFKFLGAYLLLNYAASIAQSFWTCPRCGKTFSRPARFFLRGGGYKGGIAPQCVHCGLPQFAPDRNAAAAIPKCPKCGTAWADKTARFCVKCGAAAPAQ